MVSMWLAQIAMTDGAWGFLGAVVGAVLAGVVTYVVQRGARTEARAAEARAVEAQRAAEERADASEQRAALRAAYVQLMAWAGNFVDSEAPDRIRRAPDDAVSLVQLDGPEPVLVALEELQRVRSAVDGADWAIRDARARLRLVDAIREAQGMPVPAAQPADHGATR